MFRLRLTVTTLLQLLVLLILKPFHASTNDATGSIINDYLALNLPVVYNIDGQNHTAIFELRYRDLYRWRAVCNEFTSNIGVPPENFILNIASSLEQLQYPQHLISGMTANKETTSNAYISSTVAVRRLLHAAEPFMYDIDTTQRQLSLLHSTRDYSNENNHPTDEKEESVQSSDVSLIDRVIEILNSGNAMRSKIPSVVLSSTDANTRPRFIVYGSLDAYTGGTTSMLQLTNLLNNLGYTAFFCHNHNRYHKHCARPIDTQIIITGEWCRGVLDEYISIDDADVWHTSHGNFEVPFCGNLTTDSSNPTCMRNSNNSSFYNFRGRGVQYFLGFHHWEPICRGRVAVSNTHYQHFHLGELYWNAYYLLMPVAEQRKVAFEQLLRAAVPDSGNKPTVSILKEDLVLFDPDFFHDYPPEHPDMEIHIPEGFKMLYVKAIPSAQMPLLLQRAKVVVDFALPGAERLISEAIMNGAIPIVSNRWAGASEVDYPGLYRVDPHNYTQISSVLGHVLMNYEHELSSKRNGQFLAYVLQQWRLAVDTTDVFFGSSYLHFVLSASQLHDEYIVCLQILSILYLFPLSRIDVYVTDVKWFMRHHYAFFALLKRAGYTRVDPFDPMEWGLWKSHDENKQSFVHFKRLNEQQIDFKQEQQHEQELIIWMRDGYIFTHPDALFSIIENSTRMESLYNTSNPFIAVTVEMQSADCLIIDKEGSTGENDNRCNKLVAAVISIHGDFNNHSEYNPSMIHHIFQAHEYKNTSNEIDFHTSLPESLINVCKLLDEDGIDSRPVFNIRNSNVWKSLTAIVRSSIDWKCDAMNRDDVIK